MIPYCQYDDEGEELEHQFIKDGNKFGFKCVNCDLEYFAQFQIDYKNKDHKLKVFSDDKQDYILFKMYLPDILGIKMTDDEYFSTLDREISEQQIKEYNWELVV